MHHVARIRADGRVAHCSVSHLKCRKFIAHASLILSCICIVWSRRCGLHWSKRAVFLLGIKAPAKADTRQFFFPPSSFEGFITTTFMSQ